MKRIEIDIIDPKLEQAALLAWAARADAGVQPRPSFTLQATANFTRRSPKSAWRCLSMWR